MLALSHPKAMWRGPVDYGLFARQANRMNLVLTSTMQLRDSIFARLILDLCLLGISTRLCLLLLRLPNLLLKYLSVRRPSGRQW